MAVIKQRTFGTQVDTYLAMEQEEFLRPMGIGTDWTTVRVSVSMAVENYTLANFSNGAFQLGLCSGTAFPYASAYTTNYVGLQWGASNGQVAGGTWTYTLNGGDSYYSPQGYSELKRVGTTTTMYATGSGFAPRVPIAGIAAKRGFVCVIFTKQAGAILVQGGAFNSGTYPDITPAYFIDCLDQPSAAPAVLGQAVTVTGGTSIPFSESNGVLNTISVFWNRMYPMEIYAVGVTRIA